MLLPDEGAAVAESAQKGYGSPGQRPRVSPLLFGLLATAGAALYVAIGLDRLARVRGNVGGQARVAAMVDWSLLGVLGVLLAVPAYASVQLLVREVVFPRQEAR